MIAPPIKLEVVTTYKGILRSTLLPGTGCVVHGSAWREEIFAWWAGYACGRPILLSAPFLGIEDQNFTTRILSEMAKIPFGSTVSYKTLASYSGSPRAARAVGNVCRRNPFPLLIPCHRVIGSSGLGGFGYGLEMKQLILNFESQFGMPLAS